MTVAVVGQIVRDLALVVDAVPNDAFVAGPTWALGWGEERVHAGGRS